MSTWNYRVVRHTDGDEPYLAIHETHYDNTGKLSGWTKEPVSFQADESEGVGGLRLSLERAIEALSKPVINAETGHEGKVAAITEIGRRCAALPSFDGRAPDEIIGYDENGLPS